MAINPSDLLNRLPSASELLDKPPIRALVDRWNRSVVAENVRSFLDELKNEFEHRTADLPPIRELAERAARYFVSKQHQSLGVVINASGRLVGAPWLTTPLAESALERSVALGREYTQSPAASDGLSTALCQVTGAEAAAVVHSYSSAIWLILAAIAADRQVLVARAEAGDVDDIDSIPKLAAAARVTLREVGATNRSTAGDYEVALSNETAAILKINADTYHVAGETASATLEELVPLARDRELPLVDILGAAPLVEPPANISWPRRSARESLAAGAEIVILRGDGLVGGPSCGIVLGKRDVIDRLVQLPLYAAMKLDPLRAAALAATIECYTDASRGAESLPAWQCLATSVENLKNRAERMAGQLAHAPGVASAAAIETRSPLSAAIAGEGWPSYGVALTASDNNIAALDERLKATRIPIVGRIEGSQLVLDLRTVLPRQDRLLVDSLLGPGS